MRQIAKIGERKVAWLFDETLNGEPVCVAVERRHGVVPHGPEMMLIRLVARQQQSRTLSGSQREEIAEATKVLRFITPLRALFYISWAGEFLMHRAFLSGQFGLPQTVIHAGQMIVRNRLFRIERGRLPQLFFGISELTSLQRSTPSSKCDPQNLSFAAIDWRSRFSTSASRFRVAQAELSLTGNSP